MDEQQTEPRTLQELLPPCLTALAHPEQAGDLSPCLEILRQAIERCDCAALRALLVEISYPLIARYCPPELSHCLPDVQQEVALRLLRRFSNPARPFVVESFPAYLKYLSKTVRSVTHKMLKHEQTIALSEDHVQDDRESETVEQAQLALRMLDALPNPLQRECLRRRYLLDQSPAEIVQALRPLYPDITKEQVYRALERGLRQLRENAHLCGYPEME